MRVCYNSLMKLIHIFTSKNVSPSSIILLDRGSFVRELVTHTYFVTPLGVILVPSGFTTDFASVPKSIKAIYSFKSTREAALLHDFLYSKKQLSRKTCDNLFLEQMKLSGVSWFVRTVFYHSVRVFGGSHYA